MPYTVEMFPTISDIVGIQAYLWGTITNSNLPG